MGVGGGTQSRVASLGEPAEDERDGGGAAVTRSRKGFDSSSVSGRRVSAAVRSSTRGRLDGRQFTGVSKLKSSRGARQPSALAGGPLRPHPRRRPPATDAPKANSELPESLGETPPVIVEPRRIASVYGGSPGSYLLC